MYGAATSGPRLAKSVLSDFGRLRSKGEKFEIKKQNGMWTLTLSDRNIRSLEGMADIPDIEKVQQLFLSFNQLENLQGMPELPVLQWLDLSFNELKDLQGMPKLPALKHLNLSGNKLSDEVKQEIRKKYPYSI
jgi:internalin A